jgi:hypothetical protein
VMKETNGKGNPKLINQILKEKLKKWSAIYIEKSKELSRQISR